MHRSLLIAGAAAAALVVGMAPSLNAAETPAATPQRVDDFQLTDHTRMHEHLYYYGYVPAVVIMTRVNGSAVSRANAQALEKLNAAYQPKGVVVWALDSTDTRDAVAAEAKAQNLAVPVLMDEQQLVGEGLGVQREGETFVINPKTWNVVYRGPVAGAGAAVEALVAGARPELIRAGVTSGKAIAFPVRDHAADFAQISYAKTIAPILQEKCVSCHVNGGIGPFAMNSYETIRGFAPMIRETVRTQRMPPYFADPHIGVFKNDQGLTADETKLLVHWIEGGAPRGEGPDPLLANKDKRAPDWPVELGKPDVVVSLPAYKVPATGLVEYQNQVVANPFDHDTWLKAIAMKPGDRRVLHHVVSNHIPDPKDPPKIPGGSVGSYTPGAQPQVMADGAGAPVPAGGRLYFQMHYTTMGKETTDVTQVGFYTMKEPPKYIKRSAVISSRSLYIPAGDGRHKEVAYMTFPADAYLYTLYPHAHYRGSEVELKEITPDGKETLLLSLPKYDFNWQRDYDPVTPIHVTKGTRLVATWVYDNSEHNHANPDPKRNVTWGEQTPDEMMYFRVNYRWADETPSHVRDDLQQQLFASETVGSLDSNLDGFIEPNELKSQLPFLAAIKARFAEYDVNHDGKLDAAEMAKAMPRWGGGRGRRQAKAEDVPNL